MTSGTESGIIWFFEEKRMMSIPLYSRKHNSCTKTQVYASDVRGTRMAVKNNAPESAGLPLMHRFDDRYVHVTFTDNGEEVAERPYEPSCRMDF